MAVPPTWFIQPFLPLAMLVLPTEVGLGSEESGHRTQPGKQSQACLFTSVSHTCAHTQRYTDTHVHRYIDTHVHICTQTHTHTQTRLQIMFIPESTHSVCFTLFTWPDHVQNAVENIFYFALRKLKGH